MQLSDFTEFYNTYIRNYAPYADKLFHKYFFNYLHNSYINNKYIEIPTLFKQMFEEHLIPVEMYSRILLSNGFPYSLIQSISNDEQLTLLDNFMDYNASKGTVEIITRVAKSDSDKFGIYELYIDKQNDEWKFIPGLIYKDPDIEPISSVFDYNEIYYSTNNYFIDTNQLDNNADIIYPIKSNLLYIHAVKVFNHTMMDGFINGIILKTFKNSNFTLYFNNDIYAIDFITAYNLYYYVLLTKYPTLFKNTIPTVSYKTTDDYANVDVSDISTLLTEYVNISDRIELSDFLQTYIYDGHINSTIQSLYTQSGVFINNVIANTSANLISNIDNFLNTDNDNYGEILTSIKNSFITWNVTGGVDNDIFGLFLQTFPNDPIPFKDKFSYKLLNFFKPYHVELVVDDSSTDTFNNRNTSGFTSHEVVADDLDFITSVQNVSHGYNFNGDILMPFDYLGTEITDVQNVIVVTSEQNPGDGQTNVVNHILVDLNN